MKQKPLKTKQTKQTNKQKTEILALMNTANELKNSEESFNRRLHYAEERISNWEDRSFEIRQLEQQKEKKMRKKAYENCGISLTEIIYKLLEFWSDLLAS